VTLLEEQIGASLFERRRGPKGVRLTAAGELLLNRVVRSMEEMSRGIGEIENLRTQRTGKVAVGTSDALARDILPPLLTRIHRANPRMNFEIRVATSPELLDQLLDNELDVLLAYDLPRRIGLRTVVEISLPTCAVVPVGHPLAGRESATLSECTQYPLALLDDAQRLGGILGKMFAESGVKPEPLIKTNSFVLMRDVAAQGLAISIQTRPPRRVDSPSDGFIYVPLRGRLANFSVLSCCVRTGRRLTPAAGWFVDRLVESLKEAPVV
jgi:DNA-binding transcriptional LysR family regulator